MNYKIIYIFTIIANLTLAGEISDRTELTIREYFGSDMNLLKYKIDLPLDIRNDIQKECRQKFFSDYIYVWKIDGKDSSEHFAVLDNVLGKTQPITFLVIFNSDGVIVKTSVIKYREQHGGSVQESYWLNQFLGFDEKSEMELGKNIDSISGATISSNSMTRGVKKLALLFNFLKKQI